MVIFSHKTIKTTQPFSFFKGNSVESYEKPHFDYDGIIHNQDYNINFYQKKKKNRSRVV